MASSKFSVIGKATKSGSYRMRAVSQGLLWPSQGLLWPSQGLLWPSQGLLWPTASRPPNRTLSLKGPKRVATGRADGPAIGGVAGPIPLNILR
ncbi:MAG: hypothetical protein KDB22_20040 [Planctomycetales bacterium]|nr:hypothetical protein [Planctomycetales bacterium]